MGALTWTITFTLRITPTLWCFHSFVSYKFLCSCLNKLWIFNRNISAIHLLISSPVALMSFGINPVLLPAEVEKGCVALLTELLVLLTLGAAHAFHHLLVQLHRGRKGLGVPAQNITKVNVKQFTCRRRKGKLWT